MIEEIFKQLPYVALGVLHSMYGKDVFTLEGALSLICFVIILSKVGI